MGYDQYLWHVHHFESFILGNVLSLNQLDFLEHKTLKTFA
jgi:hypothetical protein